MRISKITKFLPVLLIWLTALSCDQRVVTYFPNGSNPSPNPNGDITYIYTDLFADRITTDSRNNTFPDYSAVTQKTVYQKEGTLGNHDIYINDLTGGNEIRLTDSNINEVRPAFSPQGDYIAFYRGSSLYLMTSSGTDIREISHTPVDTSYPIFFTPDGQLLVVTTIDTNQRNVSIVGSEGGGQQILTTLLGGFNHNIAPQGNIIVFVTGSETEQYMYIESIVEQQHIRITDTPGIYRDPVFSLSGDLIAYSKKTSGDTYSIFITDLIGGYHTQLTDYNTIDSNPQFFPGDRWIGFTQRKGISDIIFISINGQYMVQFTNTQNSNESSPIFKSSLPFMIFQSDLGGNYNIWLSNLDFLNSIY
ncbi:hypothetical protein ACFL6I_02895 [candidate division KSB1 bacterium]